jgi:hypothetical protein
MSAQPVTVEVDMGSASSRGRPPDHAWMVRLRRAERSLIVAADNLAERIAELINPRQHPRRPGRPGGEPLA